MHKTLILLISLCFFPGLFLAAQQGDRYNYYGKRPISGSEIRQLSQHRDTLVRDLGKLYKEEKRQNAPGKFQPERIALVRQYLLLFQYLEEQVDIVYFTDEDVVEILGRPDSTYRESGYRVYLYNSINNRYFRIKNIQYNLVFKDRELVFVRRKDN